MSLNYVLPRAILSSQSQPRHVLTGDQELQHENKVFSDQDDNVPVGTWTKVYNERTSRDLRKALKSQLGKKENLQPSSRYESKSFSEQTLRRSTLAHFEAKELRSQREIAAVKEQSNALQGTLDKLLSMLEGKIAVTDPKPTIVVTDDGSPVSKFELTPTKGSYKEALERSSPPTSQSSSAVSSPSASAGSSTIKYFRCQFSNYWQSYCHTAKHRTIICSC